MVDIFKTNWSLGVLLVVMLSIARGPIFAQDATTQPADGEREMTVDELDTLLNAMTPEQLAKLMNAAMVLRLEQERAQVAAEIKGGLLYDPKDITAATKILKGGKAANTQTDNIERICKALAKVDPLFGKAYGQMLKKDYKSAAASAAKVVDDQRSTYLSAATFYLYAKCLAGSGRGEDAVEVYREILINMPDRISFAASAALEAAKIYEKIHRLQYAMEMYLYCLENYALTLTEKESESIYATVKEYAKVYSDPFNALAKKMGYVQTRLAAEDSGKDTQKKEGEIIALLEDLIKTQEEKESSSQQQPPPPGCTCGGKGTCKACKEAKAKAEAEGKGEGKGKGKGKGKGGNPNGNNPTNPAKVSALVPGKTARPPRDATDHKGVGDGDWSTLPPREQEKIRQMLRKLISERHKDITSDYHSALTKTPADK
ncbi:MAG: hypothetical protein ISS69_07130 [Phycisphaerae bacterium]|nr:hypothetical protein [Phycisphaerae bacterium]